MFEFAEITSPRVRICQKELDPIDIEKRRYAGTIDATELIAWE
jgi:hypothetical protein